MTTETFSLALTGGDDGDTVKVKGKDDPNVADEDNTQFVTLTDGGDLGNDDDDDEGSILLFAFWGKSTPSETGEGPGGDDWFFLQLDDFDDDFTIHVKSMDAGDSFSIKGWDTHSINGTIHTFTYTGRDGDTHTFIIDAQSQNGDDGVDVVNIVCFADGTRIATDTGGRPIEELATGDLVRCGDGVMRPIRWIGSRKLSAADLSAHPELRPVRFKPGAMGPGRPRNLLRLSPQHCVMVRDWRAEMLFGEPDVLVPAIHLTDDRKIRVDRHCDEITYFHILLDGHHTVMAEGVECETLYPAEQTQFALTPEARGEICTLFPELVRNISDFGPSVAPCLRGPEAKVLRAG